MKILFLTNNSISKDLSDWLSDVAHEDVTIIDRPLTSQDNQYEFLISYNYKFILKKEILDFFPSKAINLHISYLPFNKGAHPNLWSLVENTPKGVTIHFIDEGLDTGNILFQKKLKMDLNKETLDSSYKLLHTQIQELLKKNWDAIKSGKAKSYKQIGPGTFHLVKDYKNRIEPVIEKNGWKVSVNTFLTKYHEYNQNREKENRQ